MEIQSQTTFPPKAGGDVSVTVWSGMAAGDTGQPIVLAQFADRTVQVEDTFEGCTVTLQGSNDGTNWHTLMDPQGNALSFTAPGLEAVLELPFYVRPSVAGTPGSGSIVVTLVGRRSF